MSRKTALAIFRSPVSFSLIVALIMTACGGRNEEEYVTSTPTPPFTCILAGDDVLSTYERIASEDDFYAEYGECAQLFKASEIMEWIIYWYPRTVDVAIVLGDSIKYVFDKETGKLFDKEISWRDDLPEHLPPIIAEEEAKAIAASLTSDNVERASLFYIQPGSYTLPIIPTPDNPCWVVSIYGEYGYNTEVIVIDAVTGEFLGYGVPIP